jgi:hypothetical protein
VAPEVMGSRPIVRPTKWLNQLIFLAIFGIIYIDIKTNMENIFVTITNNVANAIQSKYASFAAHAPYILGAIALFLFGWILAELASRAIIKMSKKIRLEWLADKLA